MSRHQPAPHDSTMTAVMTADPCSRKPHDGHDGQRRKAGLTIASRALTSVLAVAAFGLSYSHTVAWFAGHGQEYGKYVLAAIPEISLIMCVITRACEQPKALRAWLIGALAVGSFAITITANLSAASAGAGGVVAALVAPVAAIIMMALEVSHGSTTPPVRPVAEGAPVAHRVPAVAPLAAPPVPQWLSQPVEPAAQGAPVEPVAQPSHSPTEPDTAQGAPVSAPAEPTTPDAPRMRQRDIPPTHGQELKGQTMLFDSPGNGDPTPIGQSADKSAAVAWITSQPVKPCRADIEKRYRVSKATANRWLSEAAQSSAA